MSPGPGRRRRGIGVPRGVAQPGLERLVWVQEVAGSNPVTPSFLKKRPSGPIRRALSLCEKDLRAAARYNPECRRRRSSGGGDWI